MPDIPTKAELIAEMTREWGLLEALLSGLSEAQMTEPGAQGPWSVKDMLAHLSAWEKVLLDRLGAALSGKPGQYPPVLSDDDVHRFNARVYTESQERSLSAVQLEFRNLYTAVLTVVEAMDETFLTHPMPLDYPLDNLIAWQIIRANTGDHYQEHRLALEAWLEGHSQPKKGKSPTIL
jgi:hypothetical protein